LSIKKSSNSLKITTGYLLSRITRRVIHWGQPISVSIEPTNLCNLHCPECPSGTGILKRERGFIDPGRFKRILDQLAPDLSRLMFYFQGEPYLHPSFTEMVKYAKAKGIHVSTSTNGHFLTNTNVAGTIEAGLDRLIISLDGTDPKAYASYRKGGSFDKVTEGIREIVQRKKSMRSRKPCIVIQFLVLKTNQHQIRQIKKLGKELGADKVELKTAQFYNFENGNQLMTDIARFSRYEQCNSPGNGPKYRIKSRLPNHCFRMWNSAVITWDGWVVPCCYDKDASIKMGNLNEQSFREIWAGQKYREFRKKILFSRKEVDICRNCTEGIR
jgi:radical SAM protein with 4Fe4S-binding SPASM domain